MSVHTFGVSPKSLDGSSSLGRCSMQQQQQQHITRMRSRSQKLLLPVQSCRQALALDVFAGRRKKISRKDRVPVRPPSLFIKQTPIPGRRPLRCVPPLTVVSESSDDIPKAPVKKSSAILEPSKEEALQTKKKDDSKADRVSKWASLFEAAKSSSSSNGSSSTQTKDADAWFDKIFPKNGNQPKEAGNAKLNSQQEKSIQQLQTLVKTLGVATRTPTPAPRRTKPNKIRAATAQDGVDPVPFSSILKKLQSVSQHDNPSKVEAAKQQREKLSDLQQQQQVEDEVEDEIEDKLEDEVEDSAEDGSTDDQLEEEEESASDEELQGGGAGAFFSEPGAVQKAHELSKMTVMALKSLAKSKGFSGYSKLKKDDLVQLLIKDD